MKRLYYLSNISFSHVDLGVLYNLSKKYNITYGVILYIKDEIKSVDQEIIKYCKKYNIKLELFYFKRRQRDLRNGIAFLKVLRSIRKSSPDIIYTFSFDNPLLCILGLTLNSKKTIVFIHDVEFHSNYQFAHLLKIGRKITMYHFNNFQVFSKNQGDVFSKWYPLKKLSIIGLPLTDFGDSYKKTLNEDIGIVRFLFFGNILPYKNLELLISAANSLNSKYSNYEVVIAGKCDNWHELYEPLIRNNNKIKQIIRYVKNDEIPELFLNSHYLVLPYKDATQSGPLMIAYNYNLPVIASNIDAFKEVIKNGVSGFLFDLNSSDSLEITMEMAIRRTPDEYRKLLNECKFFVNSNFSSESVCQKYQIMFDNLSSQ